MAETKNTFIRSKMNKDLDARLVPNGEYRDATNIAISQAEGADVGTLRNILGNIQLTDFGLDSSCNADIIGYLTDSNSQSVYLFISNFIDTSTNGLDLYPPSDAICEIWRRNLETNINTKLVEGQFLNFSILNPINDINLLEDLLFWTDNRNQPRRINVDLANPGNNNTPTYYTNEDQISVATYSPYNPISLIKNYIVTFEITDNGNPGSSYDDLTDTIVTTTAQTGNGEGLTVKITGATLLGDLEAIEIIDQGKNYEDGDIVNIAPRFGTAQITLTVEEASTMKDTCTEHLPSYLRYEYSPATIYTNGGVSNLNSASVTQTIGQGAISANYVGCLVKLYQAGGVEVTPYLARITNFTLPANITVAWPNAVPVSESGIVAIEIGANPDYDSEWPGDCEYLKDKFVRFAYRFKFDNNERSLISPFTQACFVPQQDGYFLSKEVDVDGNPVTILDTEKAFEDTDVEIFQNKITNIELLIPCPEFLDEAVDNKFNNLFSELHVTDIEILYKDDNETSVKLLDTIPNSTFTNINNDTLIYNYQSRKPIRTLPESDLTRVSDSVPIRAQTQEIIGNRILYGNYVDSHTSNDFLNFEVAAHTKPFLASSNVKKEYQNHTLKQNRTYQVGVVLSDRYGRQSDVIVSNISDSSTEFSTVVYSGSTIFHPYYSADPGVLAPSTTWPGDMLRLQFNSPIPNNIGVPGYPGLFAGLDSGGISNIYPGNAYTGPGATNVATTTSGIGTGLTVDYTTFKSTGLSYIVSVTINNPGDGGYVDGDVINIVDGTIPAPASGTDYATFIYSTAYANPNLTGWYSYKVVVKQNEQDYYNAYLPGIVNGTFYQDGLSSGTEASASLFGDNINKIPKDLRDVGPSQTNYNSKENLSLRVINTDNYSNIQFYPGTNLEKVTQISELNDLGIDITRTSSKQKTNEPVGVDTIEIEGYNDKIQRGMAIVSVDSGGTEIISASEGYYVKSYYADNADSIVVLNQNTTVATSKDDVWTFGPPGIIFNAGNNPLIGILSTSEQIGVSETIGFNAQLAVVETQPFISNLDLYYETTTAGLISDLNTLIAEGTSPDVIANITGITLALDESQTGNVVCTNTFTAISNNNTPIVTGAVTGELLQVTDNNNADRSSEFILLDDGSGTFSISTQKSVGEGFWVGKDTKPTDFNFDVKLTYDNIDVFGSFQGEVQNLKPEYVGGLPSSSWSPSGSVVDFHGLYEAENGSGDASLKDLDLEWELVSAIVIDGQNKSEPEGWVSDDPYQPFPQGYWTTGQVNDKTPPSWAIQENQDVKGRFFSLTKEDKTGSDQTKLSESKMYIKSIPLSLQAGGDLEYYIDADGEASWYNNIQFGITGQIFPNEDPTHGSLRLNQLIQALKFRLTIVVRDRNGSGPEEGTDIEVIATMGIFTP